MNRRRSGILIVVIAALIFLAVNLLDLLRGKAFSFGPVQLLISLLCLAAAVVGALIGFSHIGWRRLLDGCENGLSAFSRWLQAGKRPAIIDGLVIAGFALFALVYTLGRWNGVSPFIYLGSDASYISSYAASLDHPSLFQSDYFLSNGAHVSSYFALHIPLIRFLNPLVGGYGNAFLVLLPITLFFKLLGFYSLGKKLFNNRGLALLLTVITYPVIYTGAWDYWGLLGDALPRNLFEVAFPWLILWSIQWIDRPKRWYLLSFIVGLLAYVHSISAGIIFVVLSFLYLLQSPAPLSKRLKQVCISVMIFAATLIPFAYIYLTAYSSAQTIPVPYEQLSATLIQTYGSSLLNLSGIFSTLVNSLWASGILVLAVIALAYFLATLKKRDPDIGFSLLLWIAGMVMISLLVPLLEGQLDPWLHLITLRMYLPRGLRFIPPLLMLFIFTAFFGTKKDQPNKYSPIRNSAAVLLVTASLVLTIANNQQGNYFTAEIKCLSTARLACPTQQEMDAVDVIHALDRYTTPNDTILAVPPLNVPFSTAIRFQALRNMGYSKADVVRMDDDPAMAQKIQKAMTPWNALEHADEDTRLASYLSLAGNMRADYLIVQLSNFNQKSVSGLDPVYANKYYALVKVGN